MSDEDAPQGELVQRLRRSVEGLVGVPATEGNDIVRLRNGDQIFPAMLEAIRAATRTVDMLTFVYWKGHVATDFAEALAERAASGVRVRLLLDAIGARQMDKTLLEKITAAGGYVEWFRPPAARKPRHLNRRTHRKVLICDEEVGFTGGVGIADEWRGDARNAGEWRDTHFRVQGPAVDGLRAAFAQNWAETGQPLFDPDIDRFPEQPQRGTSTVQVVRGSSDVGWCDIATVFRALIQRAQTRIRVTTAYFNPDDDYIEYLGAAVERGVRVEVLVPGDKIDKRMSQIIAQEDYQGLLDTGSHLWTYDTSMLHAKVLTVDGIASVVGSPNVNQRSMNLDEEVALVVLDPELAQTLDADFDNDLRTSTRLTADNWAKRGIVQKALERTATLVEDFF
ncbi:MAG: phospholipase D-like domain-containing protein [Actinomycetota bacterium]